MGYILAISYRILSIPVNLFLLFLVGLFVYQMNTGFNAYMMGAWGAILMLLIIFWILNSVVLILQSRKLIKIHRRQSNTESLDDDMLEQEEVEMEAFNGALFWLISSIMLALFALFIGFVGVVNMLDLRDELEYMDYQELRGFYVGFGITMVLGVYGLLQLCHAIWLLVIMQKGGAWKQRTFGRR